MRVSTSYQYQLYQSEIDKTSTAYFNAQQAVSTGKKISQLSDDPYGATTAISLRSLRSQLQQYSSNLTQAKGYLGFTDSALSETQKLMNSAYQLAVQGANSTLDQNGLTALANQVNDLQSRLVQLGNTQGPNGQYIFGGQVSDAPPFSATNGALTYHGDNNSVVVETGPTDQMTVNVQGGSMFSSLYTALGNLKSNLSSGNLSAISSGDITAIKDSLSTLSETQGAVGAKLQSIDSQTADNTRRMTQFSSSISNVEDVDVAQAMVQLTQAQTAYQAALLTTGRAHQFSLLDYMPAA